MIRTVFDTNLLVSALINPHGVPAKILDVWEHGEIILITSDLILDEVRRILRSSRVRKYHRQSEAEIEDFLDELREFCVLVPGDVEVSEIEEDPSDDKFLACALEGEADFIVSGDRHLKGLRTYHGIQIVSPAAFLATLQSELT